MNKAKVLEEIAQEIAHCEICREGKIGLPVPGEGNPDGQVMFVGEAPGKTEAKTGRPFIGRSGKLLRTLIHEAGMNDLDVYITSPVKYLPKRGTPTAADIAHGRTHFLKQVEVIDPQFIVMLGSVAAQGILNEKHPINKEHGQVFERNGRKHFLTFHPAAALRFPQARVLIKEDFKKLKKLLSS